MVWIPATTSCPCFVVPRAVKGITVQDYGDATHAFAAFSAGDRVGVAALRELVSPEGGRSSRSAAGAAWRR